MQQSDFQAIAIAIAADAFRSCGNSVRFSSDCERIAQPLHSDRAAIQSEMLLSWHLNLGKREMGIWRKKDPRENRCPSRLLYRSGQSAVSHLEPNVFFVLYCILVTDLARTLRDLKGITSLTFPYRQHGAPRRVALIRGRCRT
jgi:hypothetical protein